MILLWRVFTVLFALVVAAATVAAQTADERITIDFEGLAKGQIVSTIGHPGSDKSIRVYGVNPGFKQGAAVVFDSSVPGAETSLCKNDRALGKVLIVNDNLSSLTEDGLVKEPNDEGRIGSRLLFDFSDIGPVTIHGLAVIDVEEPDAEIWFYSVGIGPESSRPSHKRQLAHYLVHTENNGVARLFDPELRDQDEGCHVTLVRRKVGKPLDPVAGVNGIEIGFSGSGAIARIIYSVPG